MLAMFRWFLRPSSKINRGNMTDVAVDVPSSSSRPGSAQQHQAHHQLPASINMGPASKMPKGPLGVPLMSSSPSQVDIMAKFESGYRSSSPIRNRNDVEDRALPPQPAPNRPLSEFVKRIEGKIRQRAEATKKELQKKSTSASANRPMVSASIAPGNTNMTEKDGSHIDRAVSPSFPDHTPLPHRALLSRPTSKQQNYRASSPMVSRSTSAMMNRSRIATPLSVMSMDLVPPPPLWEDSSFNGGPNPVVAPRRAPPPAASSTSIHQWVDARQAVLSEVATAISPVESKKHSAAPRTLANSAIRWRGIRAASALARAFECARTQEELLMDGSIRLPQRLM